MKLLIAGASGFAGGEVLDQALASAAVTQVTAMTRRPLGRSHPKLTEHVMDDFLDYRWIPSGGFDACVWCLGPSQGSVSRAAFVTITHDYAVAAATALLAANPRVRFCFVSSRTADPTENSRARYERIKGRTERSLSTIGIDLFVFRPGYIRGTTTRKPRGFLARYVGPVLAWCFGLFLSDLQIGCDELARGLLAVAARGADNHLLDNAAIRRQVL